MLHFVKSRRRGIFIISVLFLVTLVSMFVGAAIELAPWAFKRANSQSEVAAAQRAARSGLEYALARLRIQNGWTGGTSRQVVVDTPQLVIVEEQGNVIGLIRQNGATSQFRVRFNWQDGGPARDGMTDAPAAMEVQLPLVSYNNFLSTVEKDVPKADGSGYSVPATPTTHTTVPAFGVYLACEGRSGDWLNAADSTNPNPAPTTFGSMTTARVETVFKVNNIGQSVTPAVAACASTFKAVFPPAGTGANLGLELDSADNGVLGRLRSRQDITFVNGTSPHNLTAAPGKQGEFRYQTGTGAGVTNQGNVQQTAEVATDSLYKISWSDVKQAGPTNTLQGGVYTVWQDGTLHYYDMTQAQYNTFMAVPANQTNPGLPFTLPASVSADFSGWPAQAKLKITGDTLVVAGTATSDLVIIPKKGVDAGAGAPGGYDANEVLAGLTQTTPFWDGAEFDYEDGPTPNLNIAGLMQKVGIANGWSGNQDIGGGLVVEDSNIFDPDLKHISGNIPATIAAINTQFMPYMMAYLNNPSTVLSASDLSALSAMGVSGGGGGLNELPVPDTTTPQQLVVSFEPGAGTTSAVLSGPGNVTLGARVEGQGGSITAEGNINLVGLGVNLAAASSPNEGVSLYTKKDLLISTFDKTLNKYHDVGLKGVVYAWGDMTALLGAAGTPTADWGEFQLTGALVAYGKDPDLLTPATAGKVELTAERANLKFDSSYLLTVMNALPPGAKLGRVWWLEQ
ncbi:hypothetical protein IV102_02025 [bacterium]|nr:hypothetical protein [bacterium]